MRLIAFVVLFGCLGLSSCKKGKADFTIKGVIWDNTFDTSLNGAKLKLYEITAGGGATTLIGEATVGSDGAYSFTFPRNSAEAYTLTIRKDNYFEQDMPINFSDLTITEDNVYNFNSTALSWARLRFITTDSTASLKYIKQLGKVDCVGCCNADENYLNGIQDLTIICANDGNTVYSYNWWHLGTSFNGVKSANTTAFDTVDIILNY